jgi:hypothetical protein
MTEPSLYPCFLGPYGENDALLERLVVEFLRDHVYWRRNLYPEDPPAIPTRAAQQPAFQEFEARLRRELHTLSASLKRSVPFHSPRYLGHMVSDLLLPGLAAQILALPYNPNNVSDEAAPVTIDLEIKVGLQLARLLGYVSDPEQDGCAFGHLTSGGTLANFQALRLALALKCFPVALRAAAPPGMSIPEDDMQAFRLTPAQAIDLLVGWQGWLSALEPQDRVCWRKKLEAERIEQLGGVRFFATHPELAPPVVLAPVTAHYSWSKGMKMLGLGREQLVLIPERGMRLDITAFEQTLRDLDAAGASPLLAVAVSARPSSAPSIQCMNWWPCASAAPRRARVSPSMSMPPGAAISPRCSGRKTARCAVCKACARNSRPSPARTPTPRWLPSARPTPSRWTRTSSAIWPMAPAHSCAETTAPWNCSLKPPITCSRARRHPGISTAIASWASTSRRVPNPARPPRLST